MERRSAVEVLPLVKRIDKTALLDALDDRRIDQQVWICLFGLGILQGEDIQTALDHLQRRHRHLLQLADRGLIGRLQDLVRLTRGAEVCNKAESSFRIFVGAYGIRPSECRSA